MTYRLVRAVAAIAIALGAFAVPSGAGPTQAGSTCTGWTSTFVPPTTIRVYRSASRKTVTVPFRDYVETVMASEWGAGNPPAALEAGALAIKQYGWFYARVWRGGRDSGGRCFDVRDSSYDQIYSPSKSPTAAHLAAVAATWPLSLRRSGAFFPTGYWPGRGRCGAAAWNGRLYQRDAADCARRLGETTEQILRRFYGTIEWVWPGANDMTGDGRGDVATLQVAADGSVTARLVTMDRAALDAADTTAATILDVIPPDAALLGRAAADVDGDGRRDLVSLVRGALGVATLRVMLATGTGFAQAVPWWSSANEGQPFDAATLRLVAGDFTADRRADAALIRVIPGTNPATDAESGDVPPPVAPRTEVLLAASNGRSFDVARVALTVPEDLSTSRFLVGDTTGDGRADLVILRPISPAAARPPAIGSPPIGPDPSPSTGPDPSPPDPDPSPPAGGSPPTGPDPSAAPTTNPSAPPTVASPSPPPDGSPAVAGTAVQVAATSAGARLATPVTMIETPVPPDRLRAVVGDATRDGRDDLLVAEGQQDGSAVLAVYTSGANATMSRRIYPVAPELPLAFDAIRLASADFTGDGMADLLVFRNAGALADGGSGNAGAPADGGSGNAGAPADGGSGNAGAPADGGSGTRAHRLTLRRRPWRSSATGRRRRGSRGLRGGQFPR